MKHPLRLLLFILLVQSDLFGEGLIDYLARPNPDYRLKNIAALDRGSFDEIDFLMQSQKWKGILWNHNIKLLYPKNSTSKVCFLFISGSEDGTKSFEFLKYFVEQSGLPAAVVTQIPNQPLFDGRKEDKLVAFTFKKYLETNDSEWPILFPMVKAVRQAMIALRDESNRKGRTPFQKFILGGASKRGWTSWLVAATSASDVIGVAPLVFDMLNMKAQINLAKQTYGKESAQIRDYTDMGLIERIDEPKTARLRTWVDPYEYRQHLKMPKLILLGTNDPYWVVDSLKNYFSELSGNNLVYQVPNGGHHISSSSSLRNTLAVWAKMVATGTNLPTVSWDFQTRESSQLEFRVLTDRVPLQASLWHAFSEDRDFRDAKWNRTQITRPIKNLLKLNLTAPLSGYQAYFVELEFNEKGESFSVSTQVKVVPE